jgi:hypothetical protein
MYAEQYWRIGGNALYFALSGATVAFAVPTVGMEAARAIVCAIIVSGMYVLMANFIIWTEADSGRFSKAAIIFKLAIVVSLIALFIGAVEFSGALQVSKLQASLEATDVKGGLLGAVETTGVELTPFLERVWAIISGNK